MLVLSFPGAMGARTAPGWFDPEAGRPPFRDFRPTEYRGHPQVYDITVAPDGLMYFGNQEGMIEFDGARWTHYRAPSPFLFQLKAAPDGRVWGGGFDELGFFESTPEGGRHFVSLRPRLPAAAQPWGRTTQILVRNDEIYFTSPRGLLRVRGESVAFWPSPGRNVRLSLHPFGPRVLLHAATHGLFAPQDDGRLELVSNAHPLLQTGRAASVPLADGRILWCVSGAGAYLTDPAAQSFSPFSAQLDEFLRKGGRLNAACALRDGTLAFASSVQGLALVSADGDRLRLLDRASGLADHSVLSLCEDREGGLWLGLNSGLTRLALEGHVTVFDATNGPTPGTIDSWGRHAGRLYAGTYDGLYRLEPTDAAGHGAAFRRVTARVTNIFGIQSHAGRLLVASGAGLYEVDEQGNEQLVVPTPANNLFAMVPSRRHAGRFYLAGGGGLTVAQHDAGGWRIVGERTDLGDLHTAVLEADGTLWLSSDIRGYWRVERAEDVTDWAKATVEQFGPAQGLPEGVVWNTVTPGHAGTVFFTDKGARRFDANQRRFVPEDRYVTPGSPPLLLTPTVISGRDTWGSAFRDSTLIATAPLARFRTGADGSMEMRLAPVAALADLGFGGAAVMWVDHTAGGDVLWARGYNNTIRIDLAAPAPPDSRWETRIRRITAAGRAQAVPVVQPQKLPARFAYSREPLVFELAAPRFNALEGLRFQTRLLGYSDTWSEPAPAAAVSFTNLEGSFTLEARAIDAAGAVSEPAQFAFSVSPPWSRSPAAYAGYALLGGLGIAGYIRWRLAAARREQQRLERLVTARTTELAVARDQAQAADRAKSNFLAHMSHELRTPLNGIIGYAQVLERDAAITGPQRERVQIVHRSGSHLLRLINEVLDFSKIEAGRTERNDAPFPPLDLLRELAGLHTAAAAAKGLRLVTDLPALPPGFRVTGDGQKLRQILDNLLSNAVKFTRAGSVTLAATPEPDGRWRFAVRDTGVGLSPDDLARLFQPFAQAASRPEADGTGLGLVITQRLVRLLGGELAVESETGRGSDFHFILPLPPAQAAATPAAPAGEIMGYAGPRRRVFIVDDHPVNRQLLADLLTPLGFDCPMAASAEETLDHPGLATADLVITDVRLPGIDGLTLARRLRARRAVPVILSSASVLTFDQAAARAAGVPDFLPKPFTASQLHELVGRLLALEWQRRSAGLPAEPGVALPGFAREQLAALAEAGDIAAFRATLRELRARLPDCQVTLDELDNLAAGYQLERLRRSLAGTSA